jgi:hypothetical protein
VPQRGPECGSQRRRRLEQTSRHPGPHRWHCDSRVRSLCTPEPASANGLRQACADNNGEASAACGLLPVPPSGLTAARRDCRCLVLSIQCLADWRVSLTCHSQPTRLKCCDPSIQTSRRPASRASAPCLHVLFCGNDARSRDGAIVDGGNDSSGLGGRAVAMANAPAGSYRPRFVRTPPPPPPCFATRGAIAALQWATACSRRFRNALDSVVPPLAGNDLFGDTGAISVPLLPSPSMLLRLPHPHKVLSKCRTNALAALQPRRWRKVDPSGSFRVGHGYASA